MWIDDRGSEVLTVPECHRLVALEAAGSGIGRLAVSGAHAPVVVPVNFSYTDDQVLVRLGDGFLWREAKGKLVAFEVDHIDTDAGVAWSVLIRGLATELEGVPDGIPDRAPKPLVPEPGSRILAIRPDVATGRRFAIS
jgi:hypothetical protein